MSLKKIYALGLMSGTSLDGLDLAYCQFTYKKNKWSYKIKVAQTIPYNATWRFRLSTAHQLCGEDLMHLHSTYGQWIGEICQKFIKQNKIQKLDLIASHGHTIFHQPKKKFTFQLGDGNAIYAKTRIPVIYDFRSLDVHNQGEGAPLVPVGDRHLFSQYDVCLNLGGIANLSMEKGKKRIAFDICYVNMGLNYLASLTNKNFDNGGRMARKGNINSTLLDQLNTLYGQSFQTKPSLSREEFNKGFLQLLENESISVEDRARTFCESISEQIIKSIKTKKKIKILVTGGGAKNTFLIKVISTKLKDRATLEIPNKTILDFKEAMVFGFLGILRLLGKTNVLHSATHATKDTSSGILVGIANL